MGMRQKGAAGRGIPGRSLDKPLPAGYLSPMIDPKLFDEFARRMAGNLPAGLQFFQEDLQKNSRAALEAVLGHLELVTREEFEVQSAVLARTRERLEQLEQRVAELEKAQSAPPKE